MARWQTALNEYRRRSLDRAVSDRRAALFILCSEDLAAAALVAACEPALVLQTFGGARNPRDEAARATIDYAIRKAGVRHIVLCGHDGCKAVPDLGGGPRKDSQAAVIAQCRALEADPHLGPLLREHRVRMSPLWFDGPEGDVFLCEIEGNRVELLSDREFASRLGLEAETR